MANWPKVSAWSNQTFNYIIFPNNIIIPYAMFTPMYLLQS